MALTPEQANALFDQAVAKPTPTKQSLTPEAANALFDQALSEPRDTTFGEKAKGIGLALGGATMRATKSVADLVDLVLPKPLEPYITDPAIDQFQRGIDAAEALKPEAFKAKREQGFLKRGADGNIEGLQLPSVEHATDLVAGTLPYIPFFLAGGQGVSSGLQRLVPGASKLATDALGYGTTNAALIAPGQAEDTYREVIAAGGTEEEAQDAANLAGALTALLTFSTGAGGGAVASKLGATSGSLPGAIAKGFVAEGPFEGTEEGGRSLIADYAAGRDLDFVSAIDQLLSAGVLGGGPGAAVAGVEYAGRPGDVAPALETPPPEPAAVAPTIAGQSPVIQEIEREARLRQRDTPVVDTTPPPEPEPVVEPIPEPPQPDFVTETVPLTALEEVAEPRPPPPFDARRASDEERALRQEQVRKGEVKEDPEATVRAFRKGRMFEAIERQDGSWLVRSKPHHLAQFTPWEERATVDTAGLTPFSTNSGKIKVPKIGTFKVGERFETDQGVRGPPDILQELAAGPQLNRAAFVSEFGVDPADTKEVRPSPGDLRGVFVDEGGMRPDDLREWMVENGFLAEEPGRPSQIGVNEAFEILEAALRGERIVSPAYSKQEADYQDALRYADEIARSESERETAEDAILAGYENDPGLSDAEIAALADESYEREVASVIQGEVPGTVPERRTVSPAASRPEAGRTAAPAAPGPREAAPAAREPEQGEINAPEPPQEPAGPEPIVTSTKNEQVERERVERGLDPILSEARVSNPETVDEALQTLEENPAAADEIVTRLNENLSDDISVQDEAVMLVKKVQLMKDRQKQADRASDESLTDDQRTVAQQRWAEIEVEIEAIDQATRRSGSVWGRFGQFRARMLREDYTFEAMERKARAIRGRPLTLEESKAIEEQSIKIAALEANNQELTQRVEDLEAQAKAKVITEQLARQFTESRVPKSNREWLDNLNRKADESRAWLRSNLTQANAGVDPTAFFHLTRIGAAHFANGAVKLADWIAAMKADLGAKLFGHIEDQAESLFYSSKEQAETDAVKADQPMPSQGEMLYKPTAIESIVLDAATDAAAGLQLDHKSVYELARAHINQGLRGEKAVMSAVHKDLEPFFPGLTERDVRRLYSQYGKATFPSRAEDKVLLRELRELVRLQESIDRLSEGKAPLRTGPQRDKPTKKVRDKMRALNARMAALEVRQQGRSPERLASVNDARVTRMKNQIADLEQQLKTGEKPVKGKPVEPTPEVVKLTQMRDALKDKLRQIEEAKNPPLTPEEKYQAMRGKQLRRQLAEVRGRLQANDYAPKPKPVPKELSEENKKVAYELAQEKAKFVAEQYKWELDQASKTRKAFHFVGRLLNFSRSIKTSFDLSGFGRQGGIAVLAHPSKVGAKTIGKQFQALKSEAEAHHLQEQIFNHPRTPFALNVGLFLNRQDGAKPNQREEVYMDQWVKKTPGVAASARAYTVGLNAIRITYFNHLVDQLGRGGKVTPEEAKHIAYWVNRATGRGTLKQFGDTGGTTVFFAPRWVQSRFSVVSGFPIFTAPTARLRKQIAGEYVRFASGYAALTTLVASALALSGDDEDMSFSLDPKSTDFLKLKIGDTRIDMTTALASPIVFLTRVLGGKKTTQTGKVVSLVEDVPFGGDTTWDVMARFIRSKLAPPIAAAINARAGTNVVGEPTSVGGEVVGLVTPLSMSDALEAMKAQGIPRGTAITLLAIMGAASNTYATEEADKAKPRRPKTRVPTEREPSER